MRNFYEERKFLRGCRTLEVIDRLDRANVCGVKAGELYSPLIRAGSRRGARICTNTIATRYAELAIANGTL